MEKERRSFFNIYGFEKKTVRQYKIFNIETKYFVFMHVIIIVNKLLGPARKLIAVLQLLSNNCIFKARGRFKLYLLLLNQICENNSKRRVKAFTHRQTQSSPYA